MSIVGVWTSKKALLGVALLAAASFAAEKKLILHADDFGMSHSVNLATMELFEKGKIASASIMMPCPWVPEVVAWAKKHPKADLGLHLTLTSEWKTLRWGPVAPRDKVPGLLDPDGYLWRDVPEVATHATPAEVEIELRAQIEKAKQMGLRFTHLDTHMGTLYARPDYFEVYRKLGAEYNVPVMLPKLRDGMENAAPSATIEYLKAQQPQLTAAKIFQLDRLITDGAPGQRNLDGRRKAYMETLRSLEPGVTMMIIHPGLLDSELKAATGRASDRDADYRIFLEEETQRLMKELDIELVGFQDVAQP